MDNLIKLKQLLDKLNKSNDSKTKTKFYVFETNKFPPLYHMIKGNYQQQHKKQQVVIYIKLMTKVRLLISAFCVKSKLSIGAVRKPPKITERKRSKEVEIILIDHDMQS